MTPYLLPVKTETTNRNDNNEYFAMKAPFDVILTNEPAVKMTHAKMYRVKVFRPVGVGVTRSLPINMTPNLIKYK